MKLLILLVFVFVVGSSIAQNNTKFYVGTFTAEKSEGIYLCDLNNETGEIKLEKTFKGIENPSFLRVSPDRKYLYAVSRVQNQVEKSGGYVLAYRIAKDHTIHFLNKQISNGAGPCHVDVSSDGKYVGIATYSGGTLSLFPTKQNGELEPASTIITNKGSSVIKERQSQPHAHSMKFSPYNSQVFAADLGTDQLDIFDLKNGSLVKARQNYAKLEPGSGPRHFEFHPKMKVIYVINELNSTISSFQLVNDSWEKMQTISTLPNDFVGTSYCADIHISRDGKYLYGSNRGHNSIAVFSVDENAKLRFVKTVSVEGDWPRNFGISPNGKFILVANRKSNNITVFKINSETGVPEFTGNQIEIPEPVCIEF